MSTQTTEKIAQEEFQESLKNQDKYDSFKREELEGTNFTKITYDDVDEILYLIGDMMIAKTTKKDIETIENTLKNTNWDVLIPIMSAVVIKILNNKGELNNES